MKETTKVWNRILMGVLNGCRELSEKVTFIDRMLKGVD